MSLTDCSFVLEEPLCISGTEFNDLPKCGLLCSRLMTLAVEDPLLMSTDDSYGKILLNR